MNTSPNNYHVSSMPQLRTADVAGVILHEPTPAPAFQPGDRVKVAMPNVAPQYGSYQGEDERGWGARVRMESSGALETFGPTCRIEADTRSPIERLTMDEKAQGILSRYLIVTRVPVEAVVSIEATRPNQYVVRIDPAQVKQGVTLIGTVDILPPVAKLHGLLLADTFGAAQMENLEYMQHASNQL